jgi:hypothetical protein
MKQRTPITTVRILYEKVLRPFLAVVQLADHQLPVFFCLGMGWSLGGVQDRYIRFESTGDRYLGRVVAGLPLNGADFALLPPHFIQNDDDVVCATVADMFPAFKSSSNLQDKLKLCLASLVYHSDYLRSTMPQSHPLLSTFVFRRPDIIKALKATLVEHESPWMVLTGI